MDNDEEEDSTSCRWNNCKMFSELFVRVYQASSNSSQGKCEGGPGEVAEENALINDLTFRGFIL